MRSAFNRFEEDFVVSVDQGVEFFGIQLVEVSADEAVHLHEEFRRAGVDGITVIGNVHHAVVGFELGEEEHLVRRHVRGQNDADDDLAGVFHEGSNQSRGLIIGVVDPARQK